MVAGTLEGNAPADYARICDAWEPDGLAYPDYPHMSVRADGTTHQGSQAQRGFYPHGSEAGADKIKAEVLAKGVSARGVFR